MKIVSDAECYNWMKASRGTEFTWHGVREEYAHRTTYRLPVDTGKKTALARHLVAELNTALPGILWITGWGIFSSSENMALFDGYRRSIGEYRALYDAPGHIFTESDRVHIECIVDLAMYFYWDASLFDAGGIWIETSHDEFFSISAMDRRRLTEIDDRLSPLELTHHS